MSSQAYIYNPTERTLAAAGDGFSCPRLTTTGRTALTLTTGDKGMMVYDTTLTTLCIWNGTAWEFVSDNSNGCCVSIKDFGAKGDSITDDTASIQAAINSIAATGGCVCIPAGVYFITAPIVVVSNITIQGTGEASQILVATDIEVFNSSTATVNTFVYNVIFESFYINKTFSGATTKYDIHLQNPNFCNLTRVHIKSGHTDSVYSNTNVGGVYFDRPATSTTTSFCNRIDNCFIQNNSIYFKNITDSVVVGGFVWGHTRQFAIKIQVDVGNSSGAIAVEDVDGIIPSKYEGGIWLSGAGLNQIRICGNEFDGNPLLDTGTGINASNQSISVVVSNNTFWGCDQYGIWAKDAICWAITGNNFYKCNAGDNSYDDIRLESSATQVTRCSIVGNTHIVDDPRVNPGYAVKFVNGGGGEPASNAVSNETASGNYLTTGFSLIGNNQFRGCVPAAGKLIDTNSNGLEIAGTVSTGYDQYAGIKASANDQIPANGILDLAVNTTTYSGSPGGYVGHLYVTSTRYNYPLQSRRAIYTVLGYGTTATITQTNVQDGSGGGSVFTITVPSNGVIRFTDTSGQIVAASMQFIGARSLA